MLTARTKTIERTGTGRQFPPSLASLSANKFSLQIYMELTERRSGRKPGARVTNSAWPYHLTDLKNTANNRSVKFLTGVEVKYLI